MTRRRAWLAVVVVLALVAVTLLRRVRRPVAPLAPAGPAPAPPAAAAPAPPAWVPPVDGACPDGYPVKAKVSSGIYHLPGMLNYARTTPDRCYASADAAEQDGFRAAKR